MVDAVLPVNVEANEPKSPKSVVGLVARDLGNLMGHLKPISSSPDTPRAKTPWSPEMLLRKIGTAYDTEGPVHGGDPLRTPWAIQLGEKIGSACDTEGNVHGGQAFGAPSTQAPAPERRRKVSFLLKGELVVPRDTSPPSRPARDDEPVDPSPKAVCKLDGRVAWVNAAWTRLSGYSQEELVGEDLLEKMRGPATDTAVVIVLTHHLARQQPHSAELVCYDRYGLPFKHTLSLAPLAAPEGSARLVSVSSDAVVDAAIETAEHVPSPFLGCGDGGEADEDALSDAGRQAMWLWETGDLASSPLAAALATAPISVDHHVERRSRTHPRAQRGAACSDDESSGGSHEADETVRGGVPVRRSQPWSFAAGGKLAPAAPARPYGMQASPLASLGWRDTSRDTSPAAPPRAPPTVLHAAAERSGSPAHARKRSSRDPTDAEDELWMWETSNRPSSAEGDAADGDAAPASSSTSHAPAGAPPRSFRPPSPQRPAPQRPPGRDQPPRTVEGLAAVAIPPGGPSPPLPAAKAPLRTFNASPPPPPRAGSPRNARAAAPLLPAFADPAVGGVPGRHWFMPADGPVWAMPVAVAEPPSYSKEKPATTSPEEGLWSCDKGGDIVL